MLVVGLSEAELDAELKAHKQQQDAAAAAVPESAHGVQSKVVSAP